MAEGLSWKATFSLYVLALFSHTQPDLALIRGSELLGEEIGFRMQFF
jgi:hypothetical protein